MTTDNVETVTGKNIRYILTELDQSDIFKVKKKYVKKNFKFAPIQPADEWKVQFVKELTDVKQNVLSIPDDQNGQFIPDEQDEILNYVTTIVNCSTSKINKDNKLGWAEPHLIFRLSFPLIFP